MNAFYTMLARLSKREVVASGDEIELKVDVAIAHDGSMPKIIALLDGQLDSHHLPQAKKLHVTIDHFFPAPDIKSRMDFHRIREFCHKYGIHLYAQGEGVLHQVVAEKLGQQLDEKVIIGADGHVATSAALGAIPFSVTPAEIVGFLHTGTYSLQVPPLVAVELEGGSKENTHIPSGKDIALRVLRDLGIKGLKNKAVIFTGRSISDITQSQRMTLANMMGEVGATTCFFLDHLGHYQVGDLEHYTIPFNEIARYVALPGAPDRVKSVEDVSSQEITQVFIGGCTNGRLDDMEEIVRVLKGHKIKDSVTLIVCPASRQIANEMDSLGLSEVIRNSGGIIINPGCGACAGAHQGVLGEGEVSVTTTARNTEGRMGAKSALIYLASPKTAARAALTGYIK